MQHNFHLSETKHIVKTQSQQGRTFHLSHIRKELTHKSDILSVSITALTTFDICFLLWVGKQFCNFWLNLTSKTTRMRWHLWYHWNSSKVIILLNMNCVICIHILQFSQSILMERFKNKNHYVVRNAWLTRFRCCS